MDQSSVFPRITHTNPRVRVEALEEVVKLELSAAPNRNTLIGDLPALLEDSELDAQVLALTIIEKLGEPASVLSALVIKKTRSEDPDIKISAALALKKLDFDPTSFARRLIEEIESLQPDGALLCHLAEIVESRAARLTELVPILGKIITADSYDIDLFGPPLVEALVEIHHLAETTPDRKLEIERILLMAADRENIDLALSAKRGLVAIGSKPEDFYPDLMRKTCKLGPAMVRTDFDPNLIDSEQPFFNPRLQDPGVLLDSFLKKGFVDPLASAFFPREALNRAQHLDKVIAISRLPDPASQINILEILTHFAIEESEIGAASQRLIEMLDDEDPNTRQLVAQQCGFLGPKAAFLLPRLAAFSETEPVGIRTAYTHALQRIRRSMMNLPEGL